MEEEWAENLLCATQCHRCDLKLDQKDLRILSVFNHQAICMECKKEEEKQPDYEKISRGMPKQCMIDTEMQWGDPEGFCFHHFYPFKC